jgi:addiction module HigA family antidote
MATHPGQVLREGFLVPLGITPAALARGLGVQRSSVSRLLAGQADLTPALAARLGRYFQVPARWFLDLQASYEAERIAEQGDSGAEGVTPRPRDRDFLLTPTGARPLRRGPSAPTAPIRIPYAELRADAPVSAPPTYAVRQVTYESGGVALVCEPEAQP